MSDTLKDVQSKFEAIAKIYGEKFNIGVMDHRQSEKVFENYDMRLDYGRTTPALIIFDNGKVYPAP